MKKIIFATNNQHKLDEIRALLSDKMQVLSLSDIEFYEDIPETGTTLEENASIKSKAIYDRFHLDCFSDDTGLEVEALGGRPGVYSARYAGEGCTFSDNVKKMLGELKGKSNRKARFRTVISLIINGKEYLFEGIVNGEITEKEFGEGGFGYDPIFKADGFDQTFAEMSNSDKNAISHRGRAVVGLVKFLAQQP